MFTGIVETKVFRVDFQKKSSGFQLTVSRPPFFKDLKKGDSMAVDGVCLTIEALSPDDISFTLGQETLEICDWLSRKWENHSFNLERPLKMGDRLHGHYLTGHVDGLGCLVSQNRDSSIWTFSFPRQLHPYIWSKGSIALNGVSLTINKIQEKESCLTVCLIPETLRRTNLCHLKIGDKVHIEADCMAKSVYHHFARVRGHIAENKAQAQAQAQAQVQAQVQASGNTKTVEMDA